jgi:hypothetical protein
MNPGHITPAGPVKRVIAFAIDMGIGLVLVLGLLFVQEDFRTKQAFDKNVHYERADTGIPQWFRYWLDSIQDGEMEASFIWKGVQGHAPISYVIVLLAPWLLFTFLHVILGRSIGKMLTGLRVRDANGNKIGVGKVSIRYFAKVVSVAIAGIGLLMAFGNPKRQALHDRIAGTTVCSH